MMKSGKGEGGFLLLDALVSIILITATAIALINFLRDISSTAFKTENRVIESILKNSILAEKLYTGHE